LTQAFENHADYIFWLDDDMAVTPNVIELLGRHDKDMVCGFSALKHDEPQPMIYRWIEPGFMHFKKGDDWHGLWKVEATGFACVLIKMEVMQAVYDATNGEPFQFGPKLPNGKHPYGTEDLYFYETAMKLGYQLWCDADCKVGHAGLKVYMPPK
jgi:hypothetical protein